MNIWLIIFWAGLGTYLMRSCGVWVKSKFQARWLNHVPFAVILVMAISSISSLSGTMQETVAAIFTSMIVVAASLKNLPLVVCIAAACLVYGVIASG